MNGWTRDGGGNVRVSPVMDWKTATPLNETSDVFLRLEFGVGHELEHVSALQFSLGVAQARALGRQLVEEAEKQERAENPISIDQKSVR
ncbi:hypothetical protein [Ensifer canadensis]